MADTALLFNILAKDKASRVLDDVGEAYRMLAKSGQSATDDLNRQAHAVTAGIESIESRVREAESEFARTGDTTMFDRIARDRSLLRKLEQVRESLRKTQREAEQTGDKLGRSLAIRAGAKFGALMPEAVGNVFTALPPQAQGAIVIAATTIGVAFATAAGSAIIAGILLAVGGGVLALGVRQAMADPKVAAAWTGFSDRAKKALAGFSEPFKGPLIRAAGTFAAAIERMAPTLKGMGATLAPVIDTLAPALATMAEKALPGIAAAAAASVPLFEKLAEHAPEIGEAISKFFNAIVGGLPGALKFLDITASLITTVLPALGALFGWMGQEFERSVNTWTAVINAVGAAWRWLSSTASAAAGWIAAKWNLLVGFFAGLPGRISKAAGGMFNGIWSAFKSAVNRIVGAWNRLSFSLPGVSIPGLGSIGGFTLSTPNIPYLATGGDVLSSGLAVIHRGERVVPAAQVTRSAGGGAGVPIRVEAGAGGPTDRMVASLFLHLIRTGAINLAVGGDGRVRAA